MLRVRADIGLSAVRREFDVHFLFKASTAPEIYTLSLHDALPIWPPATPPRRRAAEAAVPRNVGLPWRSEEHTSELQSHSDLVCRLLLEKKKMAMKMTFTWVGYSDASTQEMRGTFPT